MDPGWGRAEDATAVARLRAAGAIVVGKTTLNEFALSAFDPTMTFPVPRNPWNLARSAGGSSSGSGSGVAAGLFLGALGTDTGGSVRQPAHFCGITGLRPTMGLVPVDGIVPTGYTFDAIGPMARTARDCALLLDALTGAPQTYADALTGSLDGVTVGVFRLGTEPGRAIDDDVRARFDVATRDLEAAGAALVECAIPHFDALTDANYIGMLSEALAFHRANVRARWTDYGYWARQAIAQGALYRADDYLQAQRARALGAAHCAELFATVDVVVVPTCATGAWELSGDVPPGMFTSSTPVRRFTAGIASLSVPAVSVPIGFTDEQLPVGMQVVGPFGEDALVLRVADAYQQATAWHRAEPPLSGEPGVLPARSLLDADPAPADLSAVATAIRAAKLPASEEELATLALGYRAIREAADAVCSLGETAGVASAAGFTAPSRGRG
jgi:aspartyl-tRNA(Asn)/glutamyl-tRNA(Gln) amidotransferase subunit A